jgi:hypothetical protein
VANAGFVAVPARYNPEQTYVPEGRNQSGPISQRYGAPQVGLSPQVDTYFGGHAPLLGDQFASEPGGSLTYSRPYFPNTGGREGDQPATTFSPGYNGIDEAGRPAELPPAMAKRYDQWTYRRQFGSWAQNFPSGNGEWVQWAPMPGQRWRTEYYPTGAPRQQTAQPRLRPQPGQKLALKFFGVQPQMEGPYYPLLAQTAQAGSFGQWTDVLPGTPMAGMESVYG